MEFGRFLARCVTIFIVPVICGTGVAISGEQAADEIEQAYQLTPNKDNGKDVYRTCAVCHTPEGWGRQDGYYPQIAGQLSRVTIKQLADIRARNRDVPTMLPFAMLETLSVQDMVDVASYISTLPMTPRNSLGPGFDLARGEVLYRDNCAECHGNQGQGDEKDSIPLLQGQHYRYLLRQFRWIKFGKRRNADAKMVKQIRRFTARDTAAIMDYTSRLRPPESKLGKVGWLNPDFPKFFRRPFPYR